MASKNLVAELTNLSQEIYVIDENKLLRPDLGSLSLKNKFAPRLNDIKSKLLIMVDFAAKVSDHQLKTVLSPLSTPLSSIKSAMDARVELSDQDYALEQEPFLESIENYLSTRQ